MAKVLNLRPKAKELPTNRLSAKTGNRPLQTVKNALPKPTPPSIDNTPPKEISWKALSFKNPSEKKYLLLLIILLMMSGGIFFVIYDRLTGIFLTLSSAVLILFSLKKPEVNSIRVAREGITIGDIIHPYRELRSFWINYEPGNRKELSLQSKHWYMPYIKIPLENKNPIEIRSLLIKFLPEKEHEYSLVEIISRKIGL